MLETAEVTGAYPPPRMEDLGVRLVIVVVAEHHDRAAHADLAVDDLDLDRRQRRTDAIAGLGDHRVRRVAGEPTGLRRSVATRERALQMREARLGAANDLGRRCRPADADRSDHSRV